MLRLLVIGMLCFALTGCLVTGTVPEDVTVGGPGYVVEPPAYRFHWWVLPHYDVEHRYVVDDRPVIVEHHHYYPLYDRVHPPARKVNERRGQQQDRGRNRERQDDRGHDRD